MKQIFGLACALALVAVGCSEEETSERPASDASTETSATDSGAAPEVATDTAVTSDADDASDAAGDSGSSDASGDAVVTDAGTEADCIDATTMNNWFTLEDTSKCLVAQYDVALGSLGSLTWGRHGGPLGFEGGATPNLVRYELPAAATGTITLKRTPVTVTGVPTGAYWGAAALDVPFFGWTAFSYTGTGAGFPGELLLTNGSTLTRYNVNGFFSGVGIGLMSSSGGRLIHTSTSPIMSAAGATNSGALYGADSCGTASSSPRLLPGGDASCKDPLKIATWEAGSSGPIAVDPSENLFAILSSFGGNQELRAFERSTVARGAGASAGSKLFADTDFTSDMVADGSAVYWQPNSSTTYSALDPKMLAYTVDATTKTVTAMGTPKTFLKMKGAGVAVTLVRDSSKRVWVGVTAPGESDSGPSTSRFFVLRAKKP